MKEAVARVDDRLTSKMTELQENLQRHLAQMEQ